MQSDRFPETPVALKPPQPPHSGDAAAQATGPVAGFQTAKPRSAGRFKLPPGRGVPSSLTIRKTPTPAPVLQASGTPGQTRHRFATPQTSQAISRSRSNSTTSISSSSIGGGWSKGVDTNSGKAYYFHAEKGITQWDAPAGFEVPAVELLQSATEVESSSPIAASVESCGKFVEGDRPLPESSLNSVDGVQGWQQLTDQSSGKIFFYNAVTGESQWEKPLQLDTTEKENHRMDEPTNEMLVQPAATVEASERSDTPEEQHDAPNDQNNTPEDAHPKAVILSMQSLDETNATNAKDSSGGLPTGWRSVTDSAAGTYFFNELTGETSWEFPGATNSPRAVEGNEAAAETDLPDNWKEIVDPASGSCYFYNEETGETSWEFPAQAKRGVAVSDKQSVDECLPHVEEEETIDGLPAESEALHVLGDDGSVVENEVLLPGWIKVEDKATSDIYFYNEVTGQTTWKIPSAIAPVDEQDAVQTDTNVVEDETIRSLPYGWSEKVDLASGQVFYFNENSGESSWDTPVIASIPLEVESSAPENNEAEPPRSGLSTEQANHFSLELQNTKETLDDKNEQVSYPDWNENDLVVELNPSSSTVLSLDDKRADDGSVLLTECETVVAQGPSYTFDGWKKQKDESTGNYYYFNADTGEATWDPPDAMNKNIVGGDNDPEGTEFESSASRLESEDSPNPIDDIKTPGESPRQDPSPDTKLSVPPLPMGWQLLFDPGSGDPYYYNEQLGETSWDPPTATSEDANSITGEDAAAEPIIGSEDSPELDTPDDASNAMPTADWTSVKDPSSGVVYFYNQQSGETSWEQPTGKVLNSVGGLSIVSTISEDAVRPPPEQNEPFLDYMSSSKEMRQSRVDEPFGETYFNKATGNTFRDPPSADWNGDKEQNEPESAVAGIFNVNGSSALLVNDAQTLKSNRVYRVDPRKIKIISPDEQKEKETTKAKDDLPEEELAHGQEFFLQNEDNINDGTAENSRDPSVTSKTFISSGQSETIASSAFKPSYGWEQVVDESSGDVYCLSQQTGETAWEPPATLTSSNGHDSDSGARGGQVQQSRDQTGHSEPLCDPISDANLPSEWEKLVDPTSGRPYYFNRIQNTTSWEPPSDANDDWIQICHPSVPSALSEVSTVTANTRRENHVVGRRGSFASFGFGGRVCVSNGLQGTITVYKTSSLLPSHIIIEIESAKRNTGFSGPLISAENQKVLVYLEGEVKKQSDLIWSLCLIASQAKGRLRSDDRVNASNGPESAIVDLLLSNKGEDEAQKSKLFEEKQMLNGSGLEEVQFLLLKGEREEAVESALLNGHYALALLVASMCNREMYFKVAKSYTESVLCKGSPLHTVVELYCSQLQTSQMGGVDPMMWSNENVNLKQTWRKHLAAIISNRTAGWDVLAVALGDRLKELGEVVPAHVCYMVCGCSLSPPARKDSKISLLGCDVGSVDLLLLTDDAVESFCRSEAYEWAKRRGNKNAAIQSIQGFKLQYALLLSDLGLVEEAKMYIASIKDCLGFREDIDVTLESTHPKFVSLLTADRLGVLHQVLELESRFAGSSVHRLKVLDSPCRDGSLVTHDASDRSAPGGLTEHAQGETKRQSSSSAIPGKERHKELTSGNPGRVSKTKEHPSKKQAPLPSSAGIATRSMTSGPASVTSKEPLGRGRPPIITTPDRAAVALSNPSTQSGDNKKKNPQPEQAPRSAPPNLQSPSFGFMNKLKDRIIKWQNPDAHIADPGEEMQAYYDKERKVWVFPGEDPDEVAKPIGPPPKPIGSASTPSTIPALSQPSSNDPLAAMMAPPQRAPSALRARPSSVPSPGSLSPYTPLAAGINAVQSPPQFMVFKPVAKPVAGIQEEENS